jgi:hypothetical protein
MLSQTLSLCISRTNETLSKKKDLSKCLNFGSVKRVGLILYSGQLLSWIHCIYVAGADSLVLDFGANKQICPHFELSLHILNTPTPRLHQRRSTCTLLNSDNSTHLRCTIRYVEWASWCFGSSVGAVGLRKSGSRGGRSGRGSRGEGIAGIRNI